LQETLEENHQRNKMGQRGFEPQSRRPKRPMIGQATLLSRNEITDIPLSLLIN